MERQYIIGHRDLLRLQAVATGLQEDESRAFFRSATQDLYEVIARVKETLYVKE